MWSSLNLTWDFGASGDQALCSLNAASAKSSSTRKAHSARFSKREERVVTFRQLWQSPRSRLARCSRSSRVRQKTFWNSSTNRIGAHDIQVERTQSAQRQPEPVEQTAGLPAASLRGIFVSIHFVLEEHRKVLQSSEIPRNVFGMAQLPCRRGRISGEAFVESTARKDEEATTDRCACRLRTVCL